MPFPLHVVVETFVTFSAYITSFVTMGKLMSIKIPWIITSVRTVRMTTLPGFIFMNVLVFCQFAFVLKTLSTVETMEFQGSQMHLTVRLQLAREREALRTIITLVFISNVTVLVLMLTQCRHRVERLVTTVTLQ